MNNTTTALESAPKLACALSFAILSAPAMAAITYVDAVEGASGNTFATGGPSEVTTWIDGTPNTGTNDTQWVKRLFANASTVFQAMPNGSAAGIPEMTTQISGLANGNYTLWAFYWDQVTNDTQNWTLAAGLTSGSLTTYSSPGEPDVGGDTSGVSNAADLSFANTSPGIQVAEGGLRELFGANLGQIVVTDGTAKIHLDMLLNGSSGSSRTWYDGVGYARVNNFSDSDRPGDSGSPLREAEDNASRPINFPQNKNHEANSDKILNSPGQVITTSLSPSMSGLAGLRHPRSCGSGGQLGHYKWRRRIRGGDCRDLITDHD